MNISVFGLGYVGCVSAACLAHMGHQVIGVDVNREKIDMIASGTSTVLEDRLSDLVGDAVARGRLRATESASDAVVGSDASLICVGTPSSENGALSLQAVEACCRSLAMGLMAKTDYHLVVLRSTVLPGSTREVVIPALEEVSGKKAGRDFGVCVNPEFLREGSSVEDFEHPPYTLVGSDSAGEAESLASMYLGIEAELLAVSIETAEMIKYVANAFHATKICFANEIARMCKAIGVDPLELMDLFARDTKLNISPAYLRPGFAFGGSCLPKDLRAFHHLAKAKDVETPLLASLLLSNQFHLEHALALITRGGRRKIGVVGLAFKPGTDDLRESPLVWLVERLIGRGFQVRVFDPNVRVRRLFGANRDYIRREMPHIEKVLVSSLQDLVNFCELLVVGHRTVDLTGLDLTGKEVIELEPTGGQALSGGFKGACW